ncbi:MAG: DNA polymerase III subunit gamma/tau [Rhodocyclaceae bacterium]|nr:DNA polymerase III subunit gamma/tau [Rhodocyclaceae bacterium]
MSYQVLARKWRPKSFATLVGQEHVVKALTHALTQQRLHHAYLFTGTRGVGKTTIARIMAKALNCETGLTAEPCGVCSSCTEIDSGRFIDYIELDAASNRGVEDMTQLLERATYAPTRGRYKVYVIDEVHQLSGHAFNAMLKTLEEPPEHVKFILATTDPQKIPVTVLSRCLQFNLKQMPQHHIVSHLSNVLTQEGIPFEEPALRQLARAANGSMRDSLSLLDQAIAHGAGEVKEAGVRDMLGTVGDDYLFALLDGLAAFDIHALIAVADQMATRSLSFEAALQELATLFHRIALAQMAPAALTDPAEKARLEKYATAFDPEFLQLCYQIAIHGRDDLRLAPDEYAGFTMTLMRLVAFRPESDAPRRAAPLRAPTLAPSVRKSAPAPTSLGPAPVVREEARVEAPRAVPRVEVPQTSIAQPAGPSEHDWHDIAARLSLVGMARQLAQHCELAGLDPHSVTLRLPPLHKHLLAPAPQARLQSELERHFGRSLRLHVQIADAAGETPMARNNSIKRERQERAIASIESDPFVREVIELFDATYNEDTIKPLDGAQSAPPEQLERET